jgi:hypothetical protein
MHSEIGQAKRKGRKPDKRDVDLIWLLHGSTS